MAVSGLLVGVDGSSDWLGIFSDWSQVTGEASAFWMVSKGRSVPPTATPMYELTGSKCPVIIVPVRSCALYRPFFLSYLNQSYRAISRMTVLPVIINAQRALQLVNVLFLAAVTRQTAFRVCLCLSCYSKF